MSAPVERFLLLCRCLHRDASPATLARLRKDLSSPRIDWVRLVQTANEHIVGPALYGALDRKGLLDCLPADARAFLGDLHGMNVARNADIRRQAWDLAARLNAVGIEPVILKGGATLFEPAFGDPGSRMMGDLDVLLPAARIEEGAAALLAGGYRWGKDPVGWHMFHLPSLYRDGEVARVELHRQLGHQRHVLSPETAFGEAVAIEGGSARAFLLSPTHRVIHNVLHGNVQDLHYVSATISLKEQLDVLAICERHGEAVDWDRIAGLMREHGLERILESYLFAAGRLLGLAVPGKRRHRLAAWLQYRRCLAGIRWRILARATWGASRRLSQLSRFDLECLYGRSGGWLGLNLKRARYAWSLLTR